MENAQEVLQQPSPEQGHPSDQSPSTDTPTTDGVTVRTANHGPYKWVVVFACFMCNFITGGIDRSDGIFYLKFVEKFQGSAQATSWVVSLAGALRLVFGPLSTAFSNRFSSRLTVMVGGVLLCLSFIASGYAPSLLYLYFTFGVLGGFARSFVYTPGLVVVGQYFAGKPGLAVGIGAAGIGAGTFAIPPLVTLMFKEFDFWGVFLIFSSIALNSCIFGALYRPIQTHGTKKQTKKQEPKEKAAVGTHINKKEKDSNPVQLIYINRAFASDESDITNDCHRSRESLHFGADPANTPQMKNCQHVRTLNNSNGLNITENDKSTGHDIKDGGDKPKLLDLTLLKNPSFVMYCVSICLFTSAFRSAFTFLPALAESRGCTESEAALIMSISGIVDTFGRIVSGSVLDLEKIRKYRPFIYSGIILSISGTSFACPFMYGFAQFAFISGLYGMLTGAYVSPKSVILVDILGVKQLASSFGLLLLSQGLGSLLGPPLSGVLKDIFDDFEKSFYLGGGLMAGAALMMIISNVLLVVQRKTENQ